MDEDLTQEEQQYFETQGGETAQDDKTAVQPQEQQPEAQAEEKAAAPEKKDGKDKPQKLVPHQALHEERERRKDAEQRAKLLEERTNLILQRFAEPKPQDVQGQPQAEQLPDPEKDPIGHMAARQVAVERLLGDIATALNAQQQGQQQQTEQHRQWNRAAALEAEYRVENPDYDNAATFVRSMRDKQLKAIGVTDPSQRMAMIQNEALTIANMAMQNGRNPAEVIYELASNSGYAQKQAEANGADQSAQIAAAAQAQGEQLKTLARGQSENASLGNVRGSAPPKLTAQRLIEMTDADFAKMIATPEGRALLG